MIEIIEPNGYRYRRPKENKPNIIQDLTYRGIVQQTRIIDLAQEEKLKGILETFKKQNKAMLSVVKNINSTDANSSRSIKEPVHTGGNSGNTTAKSNTRNTTVKRSTNTGVRKRKSDKPANDAKRVKE